MNMKITVAETFSVKTCLIRYHFRISRYNHDIIYLIKEILLFYQFLFKIGGSVR